MALAVARREAEERGLDIELDSCGTHADPGIPAEAESVEACSSAGLDITGHRSKNIREIVDDEDTIYAVMSKEHVYTVRSVKGVPKKRIFVLGDGIPDPLFGGAEVYKLTLEKISDAVKELFDIIF